MENRKRENGGRKPDHFRGTERVCRRSRSWVNGPARITRLKNSISLAFSPSEVQALPPQEREPIDEQRAGNLGEPPRDESGDSRRRSTGGDLLPAGERVFAGGKHPQGKSDARAAGDAVGIRKRGVGTGHVPVRFRLFRRARGRRGRSDAGKAGEGGGGPRGPGPGPGKRAGRLRPAAGGSCCAGG